MTLNSLKHTLNIAKDKALSVKYIRVIVGTIEALGRDDTSHLAAGVAYFAVLSLFPLLLGFISLAGLFLPSATVQQAIFEFMEQNLPIGSDIIVGNIEGIIASRGVVGLISLLALFWTSANMFTAIGVALNRSCGVFERHPFYLRKPRDILFSLAAGLLFLVSGVIPTSISLLPDISLPIIGSTNNIFVHIIGAGFVWAVFFVLYTFLPTIRNKWSYVWPGVFLATVLFEALRYIFVLYISNFNYQLLYGTISSAIALMIWIYLSAFILLIGSEFNGQLQRLKEGTLKLDADKPI